MASTLIHFIGIGGIGVSALAKYFLAKGYSVSGSDLKSSEITEELAGLGAKIMIGAHDSSHVSYHTDRVIYTAATPEENPELQEAKKRNIDVKTYAEAVGELTREYTTITISGAHGKSTTTALCALILEEGYYDPTVIVGTKLKEFGNSNFRKGKSKFLVLEADEYNRSFLNYSPVIAAITNIDAEHLDTYKTVAGVEKAFEEYLARVPAEGAIVANKDDVRTRKVAKKFGKRVLWYSMSQPEARTIRNILKIPGEHNVSNALCALTIGRATGVHEPAILKAISQFRGAWRRFEFKGILNGAFIFSDYGHHPAEISATLAAARNRFPFRRIWCVYQPHQYTRLAYLWDDFVGAFDMADKVLLLPVYDVAGRETENAKREVNSVALAHALLQRGKNSWHTHSFAHAAYFIRTEIRAGDVALMMGAGDIYDFTEELIASSFKEPHTAYRNKKLSTGAVV
ncbi:MAG: UDP-N-acetylmuramate--alanine ligase [Parcubacteria group bacterium Gr01-1014_33]|nr:MAG: UDP-N-acetylmuramate--alanine ligase [Parcubacteria group bacterium Gr01-1014_33]